MAFYNSGLRSRNIEPVYDSSGFRSEFRLPSDSVFLTNWRLINVGLTTAADDKQYNGFVGAFPIKSIQLYDGNELLDQLLEANIWQAFQQYRKRNQYNASMGRRLLGHKRGYAWQGHNNDAANPKQYLKVDSFLAAPHTKIAKADTFKSWISVGEVLELLRATQMIPTTVFKNLRLIINYDQDAKNVLNVNNSAFQNTQPLLVVDEVVNPEAKRKMLSAYKGASWNAIEHDRVVLPAVSPAPSNANETPQQEKTFTLHGFNNKRLERLLIVNSPTNDSTMVSGNNVFQGGGLASKSQYNQKIQLRVNGANVLPKDGVTRPMERLAMLNDTWGECNTYTGLADIGVSGGALHIGNYATGGAQEADYFGIQVGQVINDLQVDYKRNGVWSGDANHNDRYNQQLFLNCFGEVPKAIQLNGKGGYNVLYV